VRALVRVRVRAIHVGPDAGVGVDVESVEDLVSPASRRLWEPRCGETGQKGGKKANHEITWLEDFLFGIYLSDYIFHAWRECSSLRTSGTGTY
jgi:hypothetical protein